MSITAEIPPLTPDHWAEREPGRIAIHVPGGQSLTYGELARKSRQLARSWNERGILAGDRIAVLMENRPDFLVVAIAALRTSVRLVPVGVHLTIAEVAHVIADSDARLVVTTTRFCDVVSAALDSAPAVEGVLVADGAQRPHARVFDALYDNGPDPASPAEIRQGAFMFYSSGTTGKPKGILRDLPDFPFSQGDPLTRAFSATWHFTEESVWLNSAPLYHAYPLQSCTSVIRWGGTLILTERFDAEETLRLIDRYSVTHTSVVPTMFVRLLRVPPEVRARYEVSSLRCVIHAGAACAVEVKRAMMQWWGPVLYEFYGGSENVGMVLITPQEWLEHPGSVGKPAPGTISVLDDNHMPTPPYVRGSIWFDNAPRFSYHKSPEKTAQVFDSAGRASLGDLGYFDEDGYLYLDGRRVDLIVSGGVNIYPAEVEDRLSRHPAVFDVAVIGVPDDEYGQQVKAVVELERGFAGGPGLESELIAYASETLARYKCPRTVAFEPSLPRTPTGKLLRRVLLDRYSSEGNTQGIPPSDRTIVPDV